MGGITPGNIDVVAAIIKDNKIIIYGIVVRIFFFLVISDL